MREPEDNPFDAETWAQLPGFFEKLPNPVLLRMWIDPDASRGEREAARLGQALATRFAQIDFAISPRRENYPYYPVIGVMGQAQDEEVDYGLRIIGLPAGYQLTTLITASQAAAFQGVTLGAKTRIQIRGLSQRVNIEVLTSAEDEAGVVVAKAAFGLAVASEYIRAFVIMTDVFPEATVRYSAQYLPHTVINGRFHIDGHVEEEELVQHIARALST